MTTSPTNDVLLADDIPELAKIAVTDILLPQGWKILIEPRPAKETHGRFELPPDTIKAEQMLTFVGKVWAMGSLCYTSSQFNGARFCEVGDIVLYSRYSGQDVKIVSGDYESNLRILNDDEIMAKVFRPDLISYYV